MPKFGSLTPILRSFDESKAREFYVDFLGFEIAFEHRLADDAPLYLGLVLGETVLHLSEHHGDASPGAALRIEIDDLMAYVKALHAKNYKHARPGTETREPTPWGTIECAISDPFGNRLIFWQAV